MRNIKLEIAYEGTRYQGWQRLGKEQKGSSIQGLLEEVLSTVLGEPLQLIGSGRTDAGVHAFGQVANCHINSKMELQELHSKVNRMLPADIQVLRIEEVGEQFHSRYDAKGKVYEYHLDVREVPDVFIRTRALSVTEPLQVEAMRRAAKRLLGTHDFAGYASKMNDGRTTVKTLYSIELLETKGDIVIRFYGDGFLYNMVRILVGTLLEVGQGKRTEDSVSVPFVTRNRQDAGPTISGIGLYLSKVVY